jgi:hypothetical protein
MATLRIYSEVSFKVDMDLSGVTAETRDYDVQQHRKEIYDYLQKKFSAAFGDARDLKIHFFEFSAG